MQDKFKKFIGIAMAGTMAFATVALAGCSDKNYKGDALEGYVSEAEVKSNGGFAVQKGEYVYFINGQEDYTAENKYGDVVKGALVRAKVSDIKSGNYETQVVVPMLFSAQNFEAGIFIYGDRVYFATPTADKDISDGSTANSLLDFKSAKLDGSEAMKDYYFRLENNAVEYRFVQEGDVVYCMYVEDGTLYSYNTVSDTTTVLVKGASEYFFDETNASNPNVYYTMSVTHNIDSDNSAAASYNQIYSVNAAATAETKDGSYVVKDKTGAEYRTYIFDKSFMEEKNEEAKEADKKADLPYDLKDYSTYPYVNLGQLVFDGLGKAAQLNQNTQYNGAETAADADADAPYGYTYTIQSAENGGLYFKRKNNNTSVEYLYYVANEAVSDANWKPVAGNSNAAVKVVAKDATNATTDAVYYTTSAGTPGYLYVKDSKIYRVEGDATVTLEETAGSATLWTIDGEYLYYYAAATNGNNLSRIKYTGTAQNYNLAFGNEEYWSSTVSFLDWNSAWYMPEIIDGVFLYSNAQSFGDFTYNYIYAFNMNGANGVMTAAELNAKVEAYDDAQEEITEYADGDEEVKNVLSYIFRTNSTVAYDEIKDLKDVKDNPYFEDDQKEAIAEYLAKVTAREKDYINLVGKVKSADADEMKESWAASVLPTIATETEEEEDGLDAWQIVLIVVSGIIVVGGIVGGVVYFVLDSKKKKEKAKADMETATLYKKRIDTTDDKSIDVYADEEGEAKAEESETTEETVEEPVTEEVPVEETTEETVEPAEEAPAEEEPVAPVEETKTEE